MYLSPFAIFRLHQPWPGVGKLNPCPSLEHHVFLVGRLKVCRTPWGVNEQWDEQEQICRQTQHSNTQLGAPRAWSEGQTPTRGSQLQL